MSYREQLVEFGKMFNKEKEAAQWISNWDEKLPSTSQLSKRLLENRRSLSWVVLTKRFTYMVIITLEVEKSCMGIPIKCARLNSKGGA